MKKHLFKLFLFTLIVGVLFVYLNKVFTTIHFQENTKETFNELSSQTNIDVIFYGSSRSYRTFNPLIIDSYSKTVSFNLSGEALRVPITDLIFEESLKDTNPKLAVLEIHPQTLKFPTDSIYKGIQLRSLDFVSNTSFNKLLKVLKYYNINEYLPTYSKLIRNHKKWNEVAFLDLKRSRPLVDYYHKGYFGSQSIYIDKDKKYTDFNSDSILLNMGKRTISWADEENILAFITMAKEHNIELLILSTPSLGAKHENYSFYGELCEIANKNNVQYLNLNDYYKELNISEIDFQDPGHLNIYGSAKASFFISNFINENYNLPDRSSEKTWQDTKTKFQYFKYLYFSLGNESYEKHLNKKFTNQIAIKKFHISRDGKTYKVTLKVTDPGNLQEQMSGLKIGAHIFPTKEDLHFLNENSKEKKWLFEIADVHLKEQQDSIYFEFKSNIRTFEKIDLFLYDATGFNGVIGRKISVDSIRLSTKN